MNREGISFENRLLSFLSAESRSPTGRNLERLGTLTAYDMETLKMFFDSHPIDVMLFCPKCGEIHVDKATPDICETCGHMEHMHDLTVSSLCCSQPACECSTFKAWLNPPHKSHRCGNCNFVWRPADVPTNGVAHAKTKGENDTMKLVGDIRRNAQASKG